MPITSARRPRQIAAILPAKKVIVALTVQVSKRTMLNIYARSMHVCANDFLKMDVDTIGTL